MTEDSDNTWSSNTNSSSSATNTDTTNNESPDQDYKISSVEAEVIMNKFNARGNLLQENVGDQEGEER